jgi:hypothetical protein
MNKHAHKKTACVVASMVGRCVVSNGSDNITRFLSPVSDNCLYIALDMSAGMFGVTKSGRDHVFLNQDKLFGRVMSLVAAGYSAYTQEKTNEVVTIV